MQEKKVKSVTSSRKKQTTDRKVEQFVKSVCCPCIIHVIHYFNILYRAHFKEKSLSFQLRSFLFDENNNKWQQQKFVFIFGTLFG